MLLYLDNSALNRPYDDLAQSRIWYEMLSLCFILSMVEFREAQLLHSLVHDMENDRSKDSRRREWVRGCLRWAAIMPALDFDEPIVNRVYDLKRVGLKTIDAFHIAAAERLRADAFLTCDDRLIRRYSGKMRVENPSNFIASLR